MNSSLLRVGALLVALVGLGAALPGSPPEAASGETVVLTTASHSLTINYLDRRGDYRRAEVTVQPIRGTRPAWRGKATSFRLVGSARLSQRDLKRFRRAGISTTQILSSGFGSNAVMVAPSRATLIGVEIQLERGEPFRVLIPNRNRPRGDEGDDPPPDAPPPDTPPPDDKPPSDDPPDEDPPDEDPPADDDDGVPCSYSNPFSDCYDHERAWCEFDPPSCRGGDGGGGASGGSSPPTGNDNSITFSF